jgi:formylmethanofuran dehydrogenase subunit A
MSLLKIQGGRVIDPAEGVDEVRDVWIANGVIVAAPGDPAIRPSRTIDARGFVVMPGGVDMHCHLAGPKVNAGRMLVPELNRRGRPIERTELFPSGSLGPVPTAAVAGARYAGLGYTTAIDAAVAPMGAISARMELADVPCIDKGFLVLLGNHHYVMDAIRRGEKERLRAAVAYILESARGLGIKIVDPGGVERWKQGKGAVTSLDDQVEGFDVTPRAILQALAEVADELALPHPVHVHSNHLGVPGNRLTTLETFKTLDGRRAHFTHVQFHSYGGKPDNPGSIRSGVAELADYVNAHEGITVDVGQIVFGETLSMTADGPAAHYLKKITGRKWLSHDVELETGCGVSPIRYDDKSLVHAVQWAIGLEWFLGVSDPWKIALSTDHPNGGSFLSYPQIIALLMDRGLRRDFLRRLPERVRSRSTLGDMTREYTLEEIAIVTRAAPARILGLGNKGRLSPGADGDAAIYAPDSDRERMFTLPKYVIARGEIVIENGEFRAAPAGRLIRVEPAYDRDAATEFRRTFAESSTIAASRFQPQPDPTHEEITAPCQKNI